MSIPHSSPFFICWYHETIWDILSEKKIDMKTSCRTIKLKLCKHIWMIGINVNPESSTALITLLSVLCSKFHCLNKQNKTNKQKKKQEKPKILNSRKLWPILKPQRIHKEESKNRWTKTDNLTFWFLNIKSSQFTFLNTFFFYTNSKTEIQNLVF